MASSVMSTTPYGRRPESRASTTPSRAEWTPVIGESVRVGAQGNEGILRFLGEVQFKEGVWAGIEMGGLAAGKGKNDGSVDE